MIRRPELKNAPYCGECGYNLTGLTESSKCPECGRPLVEVLTRNVQLARGKRWRSRAKLFGWPLVDIAQGPHQGEVRGHARGIIAIGDMATGVVAMGGFARGLVALGGMAMGGFTIGGLSLGLFSAAGGMAVGALAVGGGAVGIFAAGGQAFGVAAQGGMAHGTYVRSWPFVPSPAAQQFFNDNAWYFANVTGGTIDLTLPFLYGVGLPLLVGGTIAAIALRKLSRDKWAKDEV